MFQFTAELVDYCGMVHKFFRKILCDRVGNFVRKAGADKKSELCFKKFFFMLLKKSGDFFVDHAHSYIRTDRNAFISGNFGNFFGNFKKVTAVCADICGKKRCAFFCCTGFCGIDYKRFQEKAAALPKKRFCKI